MDSFFSKLFFRRIWRRKKSASFSPEFLVLTRTPVLRTRWSITTPCSRLRRVLKKQHLPAPLQPAFGTNCKVNDTGASPPRAAARASVREEGEMLTRRNIIVIAGLGVAAAGVLAAMGLGAMKVAQADQWPSRPITMVVPFAAGGPTDVVGRILADRLGDVL